MVFKTSFNMSIALTTLFVFSHCAQASRLTGTFEEFEEIYASDKPRAIQYALNRWKDCTTVSQELEMTNAPLAKAYFGLGGAWYSIYHLWDPLAITYNFYREKDFEETRNQYLNFLNAIQTLEIKSENNFDAR